VLLTLEDFQAARIRWTESVEAGRLEEALALVEEALAWAESAGESNCRDRALCNRAAIALELGCGASHIPALRALLLRTSDPENTYLAAYTIARHYELQKEHRKGLFYAQLARDRAVALDENRQAASLNYIANFLVAESRFEEAMEVYGEALALLPSQDSLRWAVIGYNLGYCKVLTGCSREGLTLLYRSLRFLQRSGSESHAMKAQLDLAFALLETAQARRAGRHAARALALAERLEDSDAKKNALYLLGAAAVASGDRVGARRHFERLQQGFYPEADYLPELLLHVDVRDLVNLKA
jgi:tetratricopeptide (TPR) repeat protein